MKIKALSAITTLIFICGLFSAVCATEECMTNGGFEAFTADAIEGWEIKVGKIGENITRSDDAFAGSNAVRLAGDGKPAYIMQTLDGLRIGSEYTLNFAVRVAGNANVAALRVEFLYEQDGRNRYLSESAKETAFADTATKWVTQTITFTPPAKTEKTCIMLRLLGAGEVLYDAVSLTGGTTAGELATDENTVLWTPAPITDSENLIANASFEDVSGGKAVGWKYMNDKEVSLNTDSKYARTGDNSLKLSTGTDDTIPWASYVIEGADKIAVGAEYTFSGYVYSPNGATGVCKMEFYEVDDYNNIIQCTRQASYRVGLVAKPNEWVLLSCTEKIPTFTNRVQIYVRMYLTNVEAYWDDVDFRMTKGPEPLTDFKTDDIFYYSGEQEYGTAIARSNVHIYPQLIGAKLKLSLRDKSMALAEETVLMGADGMAVWKYPMRLLTEKQKEYNVRCELLNDAGEVIMIKQQEVYVYDRPNYLGKDGIYRENGEIFNPVYYYHVSYADIEDAVDMGMTLIQGYATEPMIEKCSEVGIKQIIVLYDSSKGQTAGHEKRLQWTIDTVTKYKDDPTVFAWALMDEPAPSTYRDLQRAYKTIRDIDPNHPVFITANGNFTEVQKYCDVLSCDTYPTIFGPFTSADYENMQTHITIVDNQIPVFDLMQAFEYRATYPNANEIRSMTYQAYWAGCKGVGYFSFSDSQVRDGVKTKMSDTHLYEPLHTFYKLEHEDVLKHFVYREYPTFNEVREGDYWYRSWVKGNNLQLVVTNKKNKDSVPAEIVLTSADGSVTANTFRASVINGSDAQDIKGTDGKFSLQLEPGQVILFNITTDADLSGITDCRFSDMYTHGWAVKAVDTLDKMGILHTNGYVYRPADTITRAELAYMLVRTLGLAENDDISFGDVDKTTYYAKALAAGKAAGILNGVGDNQFLPDAEISRQDLMTVVSRGLKLQGSTSPLHFSDAEQIADYALAHVAAMTDAGFIQGNADGTVNPLGYATRAEAAVMMARVAESRK